MNIAELHPAPVPIWCLPHVSPGKKGQPQGEMPRARSSPSCLPLSHCSSGMCSLSSHLSHAGASLLWFWPLFPVCTSIISQQTKVPVDSTQESVMQFLGLPNSTKPTANCTGLSWKSFTFPVNGEHMYNSICNLRNFNTQKPVCQDKVEEKKMTVVTIQFSSQPIYPTSLLFSRQYFIIQCTKRRKKKSKQKK